MFFLESLWTAPGNPLGKFWTACGALLEPFHSSGKLLGSFWSLSKWFSGPFRKDFGWNFQIYNVKFKDWLSKIVKFLTLKFKVNIFRFSVPGNVLSGRPADSVWEPSGMFLGCFRGASGVIHGSGKPLGSFWSLSVWFCGPFQADFGWNLKLYSVKFIDLFLKLWNLDFKKLKLTFWYLVPLERNNFRI